METSNRRATLSIKSRPKADGSVSWFLWIRRPRPERDTLIPVTKYTKASDRPAVEAFAEPYRAALRKGLSEPRPEDCNGFYDRYHKHQVELGQTDAGKKRHRWLKWIAPKIGSKQMVDVTRDDIEDIRDALDEAIAAWKRDGGKSGGKKGAAISGKTAMNAWSCLTSTFKAATSSKRRDLRVLDGKANPCVGVLAPGDRESRQARRKTFLYPREASTLLASSVPLEWREVYAIALYTYLRPGELRVLTFADVDLDAGVIHVTKAWDYADAKVKTPKTRNGVRKVPIAPALVPLLERMRKGREPSDIVVPTLAAFGEDHLAQQFRAHLLAAGLDRGELHGSTRTHVQANFRSFRDSGITYLAMTGLGVDKILRRAGHDMVQTTLGYVKQAEDLTGDLGLPFGPLPASLVSCEPRGTCEPPPPLCVENHALILDAEVPEEGVEPPT